VTDEGYVHIRPTWHSYPRAQLDAAAFGRISGWLIGAFVGAAVMIHLSSHFHFWQLLLGLAAFSTFAGVIGHFLAPAIWRLVRPQIKAVNPRVLTTLQLRPGQWLMATEEGSIRAIQVTGLPEYVEEPTSSSSNKAEDPVSVPVSTGYPIVMPADFEVTVVDLVEPVSFSGGR